ncbi:MAG: nicotinate (nicotinamide) nucleotide adenylyltransferase [Planctomycetes bacterium]|nr:nicotinate (nicotinamide) nucleotide adenylyltransferase [Planctomycetota bacterium]
MNIPQSVIRNPNSFRLGIFGGSFDPVHRGHFVLAECCLEQAKLDAVWLVPAAEQPLKPQGPQASGPHRLAMLELAIKTRPELQVSTIELDRGGVSYTVDTLEAIRDQQPKAELFFLMGADSLADLPLWHRADEVCELATPLIVGRAGAEVPSSVLQVKMLQVEMPATPISSSQIRQSIAAGKNWENSVAPAVAEYIQKHKLYREGS